MFFLLPLNEQNFYTTIKQASLPVVVMFFASWCSDCAMMRPFVEETQKEWRSKILFYEVDIDRCKMLTEKYHVSEYPTFLFFDRGNFLGQITGPMQIQTFQRQIQRIFTIY